MDLTPKAREQRDQIRSDLRESGERAAAEVTTVPAGHIVLATPHVATVVRVDDIDEVSTIAPNSLGLRGCVTLLDGTRYLVPDSLDVIVAMRKVRR